MSRKDYIALAAIIKAHLQVTSLDRGILSSVAEAIAVQCGRDNPRFDRMRFMRACGFYE